MWASESIETGQRVHPGILMRVATCPLPLIRMAGGPQPLLVHNIDAHGSVLDTENGVVEPVTAALQQMFSRDWKSLDRWFADALEMRSLPLLQRVRIALLATRDACQGEIEEWVGARIRDDVDPAIRAMLQDS